MKAAYLASKNNVKEMCFDLDKSINLNLICIDYLADWAMKLIERQNTVSKEVEVFHASSSKSLTINKFSEVISEVLDISVKLEEPRNNLDRKISTLTKLNAPSLLEIGSFKQKNLSTALGNKYEAFIMDEKIAKTILVLTLMIVGEKNPAKIR